MKTIIGFLKMFYNALFNMQAHEDLVLMKFNNDMSAIHEDVSHFKTKHNVPELSVYMNHSSKLMELLIESKLKTKRNENIRNAAANKASNS